MARPKGQPTAVVQIRYNEKVIKKARAKVGRLKFYKMLQAEIQRIHDTDND